MSERELSKADVGKLVKVRGEDRPTRLAAVFKAIGLAYVGIWSNDPRVPVPRKVKLKDVELAEN